MTDLDPETKARIEAEERYRAEVRGRTDAPAAHANDKQLLRTRPSFAGGLLLNFIVVGSGFLLISEGSLFALWFILALVLGAGLSVLGLSPLAIIAWFLLAAGSAWQFAGVYDRKYSTQSEMAQAQKINNMPILVVIIILCLIAFVAIQFR